MISVIIPVHNEAKNIPILLKELLSVMSNETRPYEVIMVDDGSTTPQTLPANAVELHAKMYRHTKRLGKGEALRTGLKHAAGSIIIFMDGDLQDDPADIPSFLRVLDQGNDLVNGIRHNRQDTGIIKLYSSYANRALRSFFRSPFTDINCGFKVFRKELLTEMPLYGNNFRFLPLSAYYKGYRVAEVPVHNRKRIHGTSKFGTLKLFVGMLDMTTAYFIFKFAERPLHFFGTIGGVLFGMGSIISIYLAVERIFFGILLYRRPLLWMGILFIIVGIQILMTGLIAELMVYLRKHPN